MKSFSTNMSNVALTTNTSASEKSGKTRALSPRIIESHDLFQGHQKIIIIHQEQEYTLQVTRQGKLLLTK